MTQSTFILSILTDLGLWKNGGRNKAPSRIIPAYSTTILTSDKEGENNKDFNYKKVIGKFLYLEKSTRPNIACTVHQHTRHCITTTNFPCISCKKNLQVSSRNKRQRTYPEIQGRIIWLLGRCSEWGNKAAMDDPNTARSRMGYTICYEGCPMLWV